MCNFMKSIDFIKISKFFEDLKKKKRSKPTFKGVIYKIANDT